MAKLILASASPRRAELLKMLGLDFEISPANVDETLPAGISPTAAVEMLARRKGEAAAQKIADPGPVILAADTLVWLEGPDGAARTVLGKPTDPADAIRMLGMLSGRAHRVSSGIALICGERVASAVYTSTVHFRPLERGEIERYVSTGAPLDKAGGYGIQGPAAVFISGIEGDFYNVVGLPLCGLDRLCRDFLGCPLCKIGER